LAGKAWIILEKILALLNGAGHSDVLAWFRVSSSNVDLKNFVGFYEHPPRCYIHLDVYTLFHNISHFT
jgi:hypothetical protein